MNLIERIQSPTPKFFKSIRTIGLILAAVSGTLLAAPVALPVVVTQVAAYLAVAGAVAGAVSQVATGAEAGKDEKEAVSHEHPF